MNTLGLGEGRESTTVPQMAQGKHFFNVFDCFNVNFFTDTTFINSVIKREKLLSSCVLYDNFLIYGNFAVLIKWWEKYCCEIQLKIMKGTRYTEK